MIWLGIPGPLGWLGLGIILIALEVLLAPGSYLLWIGLAALAMSAAAVVISMTAGNELVLFGVLALGFGLLGWKVYGSRVENDAARDLHDPAVTLAGRVLVLSAPIENGIGMVRIDDTVWRVSGTDMAAGTRVKVKSLDGSTLIVEPA